MNIGKLTALAGTAAVSLLACDARTLIGMVPDGGSPPSGDGALVPDVPPGTEGHTCTAVTVPGDAPYTVPAEVAGTWTGYFQGGSPLQTTDVIKLSLQAGAGGAYEIRVTMGTAAPPPPATNPTEAYPPGTQVDPLGPRRPDFIEGFSYLAHAVSWQGMRLRFVLSDAQPWEGWCALQTSYLVVDYNQYNCVPGLVAAINHEDGGLQCIAEDVHATKLTPVPCGQFDQCNPQFCACDSCGCSAAVVNTSSFDVTFDGDLVTGVGAGHNVRLTRDAN